MIKRRLRRKGRQINNKKVIVVSRRQLVNKKKKTQKLAKRLSNNFQVLCMGS